MLRKISLPEIEDPKTRRKYEFDLVALMRKELEQGKKEIVNASDEQLRDAAMLCYDQGYSLDPDDSEVYLVAVTGENEDGFEVVTLVDVVKMYGADLKDAMATGEYTHIETYIDGVRNGEINFNSVLKTVAYRVDGTTDESPDISVREIIESAIKFSPTLIGKVKTVEDFMKNYEKFVNGDKSFTSPWYLGFKSMAKRRPLRAALKRDKTSAYSKEYLDAMRKSAIESFDTPKMSLNLDTGEVVQAIEAPEVETKALPEPKKAKGDTIEI
jgi:hypothetical protein